MKKYYVYILTNYKKTVLYIGFTGNLQERIAQHKSGAIERFTKKYKTNNLIYYEEFQNIEDAKIKKKIYEEMEQSVEREIDSQI